MGPPVDPSDADEEPQALEKDGHEEAAARRPVDRWRRNTASGAITAALALGLQQVFDPERKDTIGIEQEAPTDPVEPEGVDLHFDPISSRGSVVVVRRPDGGEATKDPGHG